MAKVPGAWGRFSSGNLFFVDVEKCSRKPKRLRTWTKHRKDHMANKLLVAGVTMCFGYPLQMREGAMEMQI